MCNARGARMFEEPQPTSGFLNLDPSTVYLDGVAPSTHTQHTLRSVDLRLEHRLRRATFLRKRAGSELHAPASR